MKVMAHGINGVKTTGFASPAQGYEETNIDLNEILIKNPSSAYLFRLDSSDIADLGLPKGTLLVVDKSKNAVPGDLVILVHEDCFLCRLMFKKNGVTVFTDGKTEIAPISDDTSIAGVVTSSIQEYNHGLSH
jgi:DNA polymerase V